MYILKVDTNILLLILHILVVVTSSYDGLENTDVKVSTTSLKNVILPNLQDVSSTNEEEMKAGSCREISLHKCGSSMVRVFRLLDFLPWEKSFEAKCTLRRAFFTCMKNEDEPCKKRRWSLNHSTRFRKKLVRSLWSTRGCVLGYKPEGNQI